MKRLNISQIAFVGFVSLVSWGGAGRATMAQSRIYELPSSVLRHPLIISRLARQLDLEYQIQKDEWRRRAREQRRAELKTRLQQKLEAYRLACELRRISREIQRTRYSVWFNDELGTIQWPQVLRSLYPLETRKIDQLFLEQCAGEYGLGTRGATDYRQRCKRLLKRLRGDLILARRIPVNDYMFLRHFLEEVRDHFQQRRQAMVLGGPEA